MKSIVEAMNDQWGHQSKRPEQIRNELHDILSAILPEKADEHHQILCGICASGELHLLETRDRDIFPVSVWQCVGFGDSALTRYLGGIFLEDRIHLPLWRAVPTCVYLIAQAKKYVEWCGGGTDIVVLKCDGRLIKHSAGTSYDLACQTVESWLNAILTSATEPSVSTDNVLRLIEALRNVMSNQAGTIAAFLDTGDCLGCDKKDVSSNPESKFCKACKRWPCSSCVRKHMEKHISDQARGPTELYT